jgi:membrane protease YdiL (CAAX protease family)
MWRDKLFWIAIVTALLYWLALYAYATPKLALEWPQAHPILFLTLCLFYPVIEEVVFRGLIQDGAHRYIKTPAWYSSRFPVSQANLITSLLFTTFHFINHPPMWALLVFIPSLILGFFKDRHNSLLPPILLHIYFNTGYFWIFGAPATG